MGLGPEEAATGADTMFKQILVPVNRLAKPAIGLSYQDGAAVTKQVE